MTTAFSFFQRGKLINFAKEVSLFRVSVLSCTMGRCPLSLSFSLSAASPLPLLTKTHRLLRGPRYGTKQLARPVPCLGVLSSTNNDKRYEQQHNRRFCSSIPFSNEIYYEEIVCR